MSFQTRDFASIILAMTNRAKATQDTITDFRVGSVVRTLFESPAAEIDELYQQIWIGLKEAIPVAIFRSFEFATTDATAARGTVTVTFGGPLASPFTIPAGTAIKSVSAGTSYTTDSAVTAAAGATTALLQVTCSIVGTAGNAPANDVTLASGLSFPVGSVLTSAPLVGKNAETEDERKARFADYIRSLSRGTLSSVVFAAKQAAIINSSGVVTEFVAKVGVIEGAGHVDIYIYGASGIPSDALVLAAQQIIDGYFLSDGTPVPGYRPAGVRVTVRKMAERLVNVALILRPFSGFTPNAAVENAISTALSTELAKVSSGGILYMTQLTNAALSVPAVQEVVSANTANETCGGNEVLRLGTLTLVWR